MKPNFQDISQSGFMLNFISNQIADDKCQLSLMKEALVSPFVLDEQQIERCINLYTESSEFVDLHKQQLDLWLENKYAKDYKEILNSYKKAIQLKKGIDNEILSICNELKNIRRSN